jgi:predicted transcriptional regulator
MTDNSNPSDTSPRGTDSPSLDTLLTLLGDRHRRRVVTALTGDSPRSVETLVDAMEGDPRKLELALVHNHLPRLRGAGVVEWEQDAGVVRRGPQFDTVEPVVELLRSNPDALPGDWL